MCLPWYCRCNLPIDLNTVHGVVHGIMGGLGGAIGPITGHAGATGHMGTPETTAFDPMFWGLHSHVDYLLVRDNDEQNNMT